MRRSPTEKETGFRQDTKRCSHSEGQEERLAVVSISDNNSNVIIGSLIKINLMSAIHNSFCLLPSHSDTSADERKGRKSRWTNGLEQESIAALCGRVVFLYCFVQYFFNIISSVFLWCRILQPFLGSVRCCLVQYFVFTS